jgi:hypothetical protein
MICASKALWGKGIGERLVVAGMAAMTVAVAFAATAGADPEPPADPVAAPPEPGVAMSGPLGALPGPGADFLLSQYPVPSAPGAQPAAPPDVSVLDAGQFLNPLNYRVPTPDQVSPYELAPGTPGPFARVDAMKGAHAIVHGALGRMPLDQLSQPLPGTAPPPGTRLPAGPVQNSPDLPASEQVPTPLPLAPPGRTTNDAG